MTKYNGLLTYSTNYVSTKISCLGLAKKHSHHEQFLFPTVVLNLKKKSILEITGQKVLLHCR
jgi:hypothetical protein